MDNRQIKPEPTQATYSNSSFFFHNFDTNIDLNRFYRLSCAALLLRVWRYQAKQVFTVLFLILGFKNL